jgi:hypothetical protein
MTEDIEESTNLIECERASLQSARLSHGREQECWMSTLVTIAESIIEDEEFNDARFAEDESGSDRGKRQTGILGLAENRTQSSNSFHRNDDRNMGEHRNDDTDSFNIQLHATFSLPIILSDTQLLNVYGQRTCAVLLRGAEGRFSIH